MMAHSPSANPGALGGPERLGAPNIEQNCIQLVLNTYAAVIRTSFSESRAFDAAVRIYRRQHPELPEQPARLAVANIICRKE